MLGLVVFLIPYGSNKNFMVNLIISEGFYVLKINILNFKKIQDFPYLTNKIKELFPLSFENKIFLIVAFDYFPIALNDSLKSEYPELDNARLLIKNKVWYDQKKFLRFKRKIPKFYFTYNGDQAYQFLHYFLPNEFNSIQNKINQFQVLLTSNYPVKKRLSNGRERRARVELIDYKGRLAVKKTYRPGCDRFWERERFVMKELSKIRSEIPPLLEQGKLYLIYPYYQDIFNFDPINNPKISLDIAKQVMEILYFFYQLDYALIDFYPNNLIIDKKEGLKIIDFEFLYQYKNKPDSFIKCYDLAGIPKDFDGDRPVRGKFKPRSRSYENDWQPYIGLELNELLTQIPSIANWN